MRLPASICAALALVLGVALIAGCGESAAPGSGAGPVADPAYDDAYDAGLGDDLSADDGQVLYEEAFTAAYAEACSWIFADSPDGYLYSSGDQYDESDCDLAEPSYPEWDQSDDPRDQGSREGWESACEETFFAVGDDLYWGDDEVAVSQTDCELASPY